MHFEFSHPFLLLSHSRPKIVQLLIKVLQKQSMLRRLGNSRTKKMKDNMQRINIWPWS